MRAPKTSRPIALAGALALLAVSGVSVAQPAPPGATSMKLLAEGTKLGLGPSPAFPRGKVAMLGGTATAEAQRFYVDNLEILQPIAVTLLTKDPQHEILVELGKYTWDQDVARRMSSKGATSTTLKTRTAGDLQIVVRSTDSVPRPFQLVVWVGDGVPAALPPIAVKMSLVAPAPAAKAPTRPRRNDRTLIVAIGAAILVAAIALVARRRRDA